LRAGPRRRTGKQNFRQRFFVLPGRYEARALLALQLEQIIKFSSEKTQGIYELNTISAEREHAFIGWGAVLFLS